MFPKFSLCTALVVLLSFVSGTTFAQGNGPQARIILFDTTVTEPLNPFRGNVLPGGSVTIFNFNEVFGDNLEITVRGLGRVSGDNIYGLYIISESSSADYDSGDFDNIRILFNVDDHGVGIASLYPILTYLVPPM